MESALARDSAATACIWQRLRGRQGCGLPESGKKKVSGMLTGGDWPGEAPGRLTIRSRAYYVTGEENRLGFLCIVQLEAGVKKVKYICTY